MDIPQPPQDEELRNIIDKLAVFVARNGPEFESMTKQKQQGNARFQFLYGGEFYNYYMYRVTTEQAVMKHQNQQQQQQRQGGQVGNMMGLFGDFGGGGGGENFGGQNFPGDGGHFQQQQHQQQMQRFPFDQQRMQQNQPSPRHMSRFDRGPPGSGGSGQFQNFERPPMRMPFQHQQHQQQQQKFGGPFEFDQGLSGQGPGKFEFNAGPMHGDRSGGPPSRFDHNPPRNQGGFEGRAPGRNRFDIGPSGGFEGPPQQSQGFPPNFQQQQQNIMPPIVNSQLPAVPPKSLVAIISEIEDLITQKNTLEEQIKQSENNLTAQNQVLMTQQQQQIEEAIIILQDAEIKQLASDLNIDLVELDSVLHPIVESCTKDSISGGKAWIFTHTSTPRHYQLLSMYLLKKTTDPDSTFSQRLHIIYLVNDVLHHCMRKGAEDLRQVLEAMVIPMFSHAKVKELGNDENLAKLNKLLALWESKCQYVSPVAVEKLKDASNTWLEYHGELLKRHAVVVTQIAQNMQKTYEGYQAQHQLFCQHNIQTIKKLEQSLQQLSSLQQTLQQQQQQQQQQQMKLMNQPPLMGHTNNPLIANIPPPGLVIPTGISSGGPMMVGFGAPPGAGFNHSENQHVPDPSLNQLVGSENSPNVTIPDISRPPPGFPPPMSDKELMPALPYYELPAGLMVPLVKPEDDNYKPIDPKNIRLPPPCPPSEKLILAVEAFYAAPSHERPRDSEGWERLGLYEYYKSKNLARKQKEDDIREGRREKSKSPSPLRRDSSPSGRSPPRRRYQSKSPTPPKRRRSRSRSPSSRSRKPTRRRSRSRSKSRSPIRRSPTPPSFGMPGLGVEKKIDESNKGHQLLMKMGWGGSGLGANEQGIEAPISGGEVREKKDLYRGVGISTNDPFESYRKSKGQKFVERMRQRAEERP